jgi:hypothetical protein
MSGTDLDLEQELEALRTEIVGLEDQLALLDKKRRLVRSELSILRRELSARSELEDLDQQICLRVITCAREHMKLHLDRVMLYLTLEVQLKAHEEIRQPEDPLENLRWQLGRSLIGFDEFETRRDRLAAGFPLRFPVEIHYLPGGSLLSVHYLPDGNIEDRRSLVLRVPYQFANALHRKQDIFELVALGSSEVVMVVPGADLLGWFENSYRWWNRGEVRFNFERQISTERVWLKSITQARPWGRGEQTHTCRRETTEVTEYLNRYDLLSVETTFRGL